MNGEATQSVHDLTEARNSLEHSRQTGYSNQFENGTAKLEAAAAALASLHRTLMANPPGPALKASLRNSVEQFAAELRLAEAVHLHAAAFHAGWILEMARLAGLDPSIGYDRTGAVQAALPQARIDCKV